MVNILVYKSTFIACQPSCKMCMWPTWVEDTIWYWRTSTEVNQKLDIFVKIISFMRNRCLSWQLLVKMNPHISELQICIFCICVIEQIWMVTLILHHRSSAFSFCTITRITPGFRNNLLASPSDQDSSGTSAVLYYQTCSANFVFLINFSIHQWLDRPIIVLGQNNSNLGGACLIKVSHSPYLSVAVSLHHDVVNTERQRMNWFGHLMREKPGHPVAQEYPLKTPGTRQNGTE